MEYSPHPNGENKVSTQTCGGGGVVLPNLGVEKIIKRCNINV